MQVYEALRAVHDLCLVRVVGLVPQVDTLLDLHLEVVGHALLKDSTGRFIDSRVHVVVLREDARAGV